MKASMKVVGVLSLAGLTIGGWTIQRRLLPTDGQLVSHVRGVCDSEGETEGEGFWICAGRRASGIPARFACSTVDGPWPRDPSWWEARRGRRRAIEAESIDQLWCAAFHGCGDERAWELACGKGGLQ